MSANPAAALAQRLRAIVAKIDLRRNAVSSQTTPVDLTIGDIGALNGAADELDRAAAVVLGGPQDNQSALDALPSPHDSFDAMVWAESFVAHVALRPTIATDVMTMVSWFATAIMRGYDEHARRHLDAAPPVPRPPQEPRLIPAELINDKFRCPACGTANYQPNERCDDHGQLEHQRSGSGLSSQRFGREGGPAGGGEQGRQSDGGGVRGEAEESGPSRRGSDVHLRREGEHPEVDRAIDRAVENTRPLREAELLLDGVRLAPPPVPVERADGHKTPDYWAKQLEGWALGIDNGVTTIQLKPENLRIVARLLRSIGYAVDAKLREAGKVVAAAERRHFDLGEQ